MKTFAEIKKMAFAIKEPIMIMTGSIMGKEELYTPKVKTFNGFYNINNSIISFVEKDIQYVIPFTNEIELGLIGAGYHLSHNIYVPFRNGGFPIEEAEKWTEIMLSVH